MPVLDRPDQTASYVPAWPLLTALLLLLAVLTTPARCMTDEERSALRDDTRHLFYHGYNNYMAHAFPEDELKPISCEPQTSNRDNPADIGLNDVLGNYSVTLIDSLSTLAILASDEDPKHAKTALQEFQTGVKALVELYGDGTEAGRCGSRACGFDLDSKVQVFETNIRGVGGLLSAHLFAIGELPIRGYTPVWREDVSGTGAVSWDDEFVYKGQLLRLAYDLASRLLPAFTTATGLPYPRVNLRHGIPFYQDAEAGVCRLDGTASDSREITETCSAGAGSLVLEFTTLSRLTNDTRFEELAKRAFWAVWERRSSVGLIGGGLDAESGQWTMPPLAGIGAGIDSFFEYALKSSILLSNLPPLPTLNPSPTLHDPNAFLHVWQHSHTAIKRHIYRSTTSEKHPYYAQSDLATGAPRYTWIDSLSAYYPGLLTLAGELEEAISTHLLYAALWTRYSALPERWMAHNSFIDPNFKHWAGRPEFVESTWYLYRATKDPWYLHVGEMVLRDVRRRCWARCGWADLGDVVSGEQRDRMESFFLGETAKYLYLLFAESHPLNSGDQPIVFSTEGHPLVIPDSVRAHSYARREKGRTASRKRKEVQVATEHSTTTPAVCPAPAPPLPLTVSNTANRPDLFHAAALAQLHLVPINPTRASPLMQASSDSPGITLADVRSPSNYTFYPWTLPQSLIPPRGTSSPIRNPVISTLTFPNLIPAGGDGAAADKSGGGAGGGGGGIIALNALQKLADGVLINSLSNLRLNMVQEPRKRGVLLPNGGGPMVEIRGQYEYRIQGIANWALGRDEKVVLSREALQGVSPADPHFLRVKDLEMVDLVVDAPAVVGVVGVGEGGGDGGEDAEVGGNEEVLDEWELEEPENDEGNGTMESLWSVLEAMVSGFLSSPAEPTLRPPPPAPQQQHQRHLTRHIIPAIIPTGPGAAPLPPILDNPSPSALEPLHLPFGQLPLTTIFFLDSTLCAHRLPVSIAKQYNILIIRRGDCSFSEKLSNIPSFAPAAEALMLVIVLSVPESKSEAEGLKPEGELIRPLLEEVQRTPAGVVRREGVGMVMVDGTSETVGVLRGVAKAVGGVGGQGKRVEVKGELGVGDGGFGDGEGDVQRRPGLGLKRRYWFESMGVPIGNLIMA